MTYAKSMAVEFAYKTTDGTIIEDALKALQEGKTTIDAVKALIEGGTLDIVKADKLEQESANEALNIGVGIGSGLTTEAIYNKFVVINGVAYVVFNYKIKNDTDNNVTIYSAGNAYVNMLPSTAEKVIDLAGVNVHATTSSAYITSFKGAALSSDYSLLKEINCSLMNTSAVDQAQINFSVSGGLTVPANAFVYFTGRTFLTLLG